VLRQLCSFGLLFWSNKDLSRLLPALFLPCCLWPDLDVEMSGALPAFHAPGSPSTSTGESSKNQVRRHFHWRRVVDDGIIIASDTRSTFIDDTGKQFGYIDGTPKVFVQSGVAFAVSGLSSISGELFNSFLARNDYLLTRP